MTDYEDIFDDIYAERARQVAKFGEQLDVPDGTGSEVRKSLAESSRKICERATKNGRLTYGHILDEEFCEAMAESDKTKLRDELLQVATVTIAWIRKLDLELAAGSTDR